MLNGYQYSEGGDTLEDKFIKTDSNYTSVVRALYQNHKTSEPVVDKEPIDGNLKELRDELMSDYWSKAISD